MPAGSSGAATRADEPAEKAPRVKSAFFANLAQSISAQRGGAHREAVGGQNERSLPSRSSHAREALNLDRPPPSPLAGNRLRGGAGSTGGLSSPVPQAPHTPLTPLHIKEHIDRGLAPPESPLTPVHVKESLLTSAEFFGAMPPACREACLRSFKTLDFEPGDHIVDEGTVGSTMYFIDAGHVAVTSGGNVVGLLQEGDFFGEWAFLGLLKSFVDEGVEKGFDREAVLPDLQRDEFKVEHMRTSIAVDEVRLLELNIKDFLTVFRQDLRGLRKVIRVLHASGKRRQVEISRLGNIYTRTLSRSRARALCFSRSHMKFILKCKLLETCTRIHRGWSFKRRQSEICGPTFSENRIAEEQWRDSLYRALIER